MFIGFIDEKSLTVAGSALVAIAFETPFYEVRNEDVWLEVWV